MPRPTPQTPTLPAASERPDYTTGCVYVRVALCGLSLRRGDAAVLLALVVVSGVEAPMPPARGATVTVEGYSAAPEAA